MPRPTVIRDDAILLAARQVFLRHGYQAGTAAIARRAGVSEGTIFKRFRTKHALFLAAMDVEGHERAWEELLQGTLGRGDIRRTLTEAGDRLLARLQIITPRIMAVSGSGVTFAKCYSRAARRPPPVEHILILARYFRAETAAGRLRVTAPAALAHLFVGALSHYVFCETIFGYRSATPRAYVRHLVATVLASATPARLLPQGVRA